MGGVNSTQRRAASYRGDGSFRKLLGFELHRSIINKYFVVAILLFVLFEVLSEPSLFWGNNGEISIYDVTEYTAFSQFQKMLPCICALPHALSAIVDFESGYVRTIRLRRSRESYVMAKMVSTYFSSLIAAITGLTLTYIWLSWNCSSEISITEWNAASYALQNNYGWIVYWLTHSAVRASLIAVWSLFTLLVGSITLIQSIAVLSPLVAMYAIDIILSLLASTGGLGTAIYSFYCQYPYTYIMYGYAPFPQAGDYLRAGLIAWSAIGLPLFICDYFCLNRRSEKYV